MVASLAFQTGNDSVQHVDVAVNIPCVADDGALKQRKPMSVSELLHLSGSGCD